ncbi:SH3 domain-containing protein [Francisellaceae bacterium CB300]
MKKIIDKDDAYFAKKITRNHNDAFNKQALKDYRITKVDSLNFRYKPSVKSDVITTLPLGTLTYVIDKSNRSWLFVEVDIDGDLIQGWISRRYTSRFR